MIKHLLLIALVAACGSDVPANPTWFADVQPVIRANCARCHGADPSDPKIVGYRLDRYVALDPGKDAADYVDFMIQHAVDHDSPAMPPDYALTDRQQEILLNWKNTDPARRKGTRTNRPGRIELISPTGELPTIDQELDLTFRAWDDDLDGLAVKLFAEDVSTGIDWKVGNPTGSGLRSLAADAGTLPHMHTFEVFAIVDDGWSEDPAINEMNVIPLIPELYVDHGIKGTAPTVELLTPNGGDTQLGELTITWSATDPDVENNVLDPLSIDLELVSYAGGSAGDVTSIAAATANTGSLTWKIPSTVPTHDTQNNPIPYRVRVTATDTYGMPHNVRADESDLTFFIEEAATTTLGWADVQPFFTTFCATSRCHDMAGVAKAPDFCAAEYNQGGDPARCDPATDKGVYEYRSLVLTHLSDGSMPPGGSKQPTAMQRTDVINWLRAGAPEQSGGGPVDAKPVFTWAAPTTSTAAIVNNGTTMLQWKLTDQEGLASYAITYRKYALQGQSCPSCSATTGPPPTATGTVTSGTVTGLSYDGTFAWQAPGPTVGCYCLRGAVTDAANQSGLPPPDPLPVKF